ncbi:hypothetical protein JF541_16210 [Marinobacter hydrocarbonoclasticus]|uniref:hypothetical protein n=1 Tax=Marinobacter nauticus TaxID=2743 RepID=UPI001A8CBD4B|nr:hypothetical protein [Marinobacter nauticus]MBN8240705.1 hypothetical protein [Marinobacter nauticus]
MSALIQVRTILLVILTGTVAGVNAELRIPDCDEEKAPQKPQECSGTLILQYSTFTKECVWNCIGHFGEGPGFPPPGGGGTHERPVIQQDALKSGSRILDSSGAQLDGGARR